MRTYKKQINHIIVSAAGLLAHDVVVGVDSLALGQTSITDPNVPTGTKIRGITVMVSISNPSTLSLEYGFNLQYLVAGQTANVNPLAVGGDAQRNQVIKSWHGIVAQDTMVNVTKYVKIPKQFQRMREGMRWRLVSDSSVSREHAEQFIYKCRL